MALGMHPVDRAQSGSTAHVVTVEADVGEGCPRWCGPGCRTPRSGSPPSGSSRRSGAAASRGRRHKITVGLLPASVRKKGSGFDLAVAIAVLAAQRAFDPLGGPRPRDARRARARRPGPSGDGRAAGGDRRGAARSRPGRRAARQRRGGAPGARASRSSRSDRSASCARCCAASRSRSSDDAHRPLPPPLDPPPDLADVVGQPEARHALEVAAAGGHHLLLTGPPGVGKTMLAERLPGLLPDLADDEALEVTSIHSLLGRLPVGRPLLTRPPFCAPHHSATVAALVGGGSGIPAPGTISLAHQGVLFIDEATEFDRRALDALRQPLESGVVTHHRAGGAATYPSRFQLVLAANPCPCARGGRSTDASACRCTLAQLPAYRNRLSGPLLDRIDLRARLAPISRAILDVRRSGEPTAAVRERVMAARDRAAWRLLARRGRPTPRCPARVCAAGGDPDSRRWPLSVDIDRGRSRPAGSTGCSRSRGRSPTSPDATCRTATTSTAPVSLRLDRRDQRPCAVGMSDSPTRADRARLPAPGRGAVQRPRGAPRPRGRRRAGRRGHPPGCARSMRVDVAASAAYGCSTPTVTATSRPRLGLGIAAGLSRRRRSGRSGSTTLPARCRLPFGLWVRGPLSLREACEQAVAIVGTRAATDYGAYVARSTRGSALPSAAGRSSPGWRSASTLPRIAARWPSAVPTVAVLACGADVAYPSGAPRRLYEQIVAAGLVVSEHPPGAAPQRARFLVRNRLIAALSAGTVVVEAAPRSGARSTARHAGELFRHVMAVPGPVTSTLSAGCHQLLRDRPDTVLVTKVDEIIEQVGPLGQFAERVSGPVRRRDLLGPTVSRVLRRRPVKRSAPAERDRDHRRNAGRRGRGRARGARRAGPGRARRSRAGAMTSARPRRAPPTPRQGREELPLGWW